MVSAKNEKRSEESLPAPVIPGEKNPEGLISSADATKGFRFECKVNQAYEGDVLGILLDNGQLPILQELIKDDIGPEGRLFEFTFPVSLASEGTHNLRQQLNREQPSPEKRFIIDYTPPYSHERPPEPSPPTDLPGGKVTSVYLEDKGGVLFSFEDPKGWAPGDTMRLYWNRSPGGDFSLEPVPLKEFGNTYFLPATTIRSAGAGGVYLNYQLEDLAGNLSPRSLPLPLKIDI